MYSKEEAKALREEFWERFKAISSTGRIRKELPVNWMLNKTGINALNLRFYIDREVAQVGIDLETKNMEKRLELFEKLESVRKILEESMQETMIWDIDYTRENGKSVSRIYLEINNVDIYNRDTWETAHKFMYDKMMKLEKFYLEYQDFFKYG